MLQIENDIKNIKRTTRWTQEDQLKDFNEITNVVSTNAIVQLSRIRAHERGRYRSIRLLNRTRKEYLEAEIAHKKNQQKAYENMLDAFKTMGVAE